ncbi:MAG: transglycosylase domain-containing protein [Eubacteriaceae bacterium]|nr:transglycosylase domain-containing protein [Eubacteriaceae bacterium]
MSTRKKKLSARQRTARKKKIRRAVLCGLVLLAAVSAVLFSVYLKTLPDIRHYDYASTTHSVVYSSDGQWLGSVERKNATYVSREQIPDTLVDAVVSIEDKRFFSHPGVDPISIARAAYHNMKAGEIIEGGSSITQQLTKLLFFNDEMSYSRKIAEAVTAVRMELRYSKDDIITMYLNEVYLGGGAYGVYEASMLYFGCSPLELTTAQCAMLAGIITAPSAYCPMDETGYVFATQRKEKVLAAMLEQGRISVFEYAKALMEPIRIYGIIPGQSAFEYGSCVAGYRSCMNLIYGEAVDILSQYYISTGTSPSSARLKAEQALFSQSMRINSTISYGMQQKALSAIWSQITARSAAASCAYVSIDSSTGNVLVYYGGDNSTLLDLAASPHQPGSTIKPLYMLYLVDKGICTIDDIVLDAPTEIDGYAPNNFAGEYYGYVTMRETLVESLNCASLKFFAKGDIAEEIDFVKSMGISTIVDEDYSLAFSLGGFTYGITPAELCGAYCVIANGGSVIEPRFVSSIELEDGTVIWPEEVFPRRIAGSEAAEDIRSCLYSTVTRGTATPAESSYATFGKTGTTDDARDVWFVGGTGSTVSAIWVGTPDGTLLDGLGSYWCSWAYYYAMTESISEGSFVSHGVSGVFYDDLTSIYILKDGASTADGIDISEIAPVTVLTSRLGCYNSRRVVQLDVDSATGLLFGENCPESNRETRYYLYTEAPEVYCTDSHERTGSDPQWNWNIFPWM